MLKYLSQYWLAAGFWLAFPPPAAMADTAVSTGDYQNFFLQLVADRGYPGAAYVVVDRDHILQLVTTGHTAADRKRPIDAETSFRLASVSKTFAAEVVALLVRDGIIAWDDPVTRHLPDFSVRGDTSRILVRHVVGQSTGLLPHAYDNLLEHGKPMEFIWRRMADLDYICAPGSCYAYQNSIFSLVEPLVSKAAGQSYQQLLEQRIFKPLDMQNASLGFEAYRRNPNRAEPHARRGGRWVTVPVQPNYYRAAPAAGVNASILDMAKWLQAQLGARPAALPPDLVGQLFEPRVKTRRELYRKHWKHMLSDAHYGLGWRIYRIGDEQLVYHGGWVAGFRADVAFSPRLGLGFAVLLNAESNGINELTTHFWQMTLAAP